MSGMLVGRNRRGARVHERRPQQEVLRWREGSGTQPEPRQLCSSTRSRTGGAPGADSRKREQQSRILSILDWFGPSETPPLEVGPLSAFNDGPWEADHSSGPCWTSADRQHAGLAAGLLLRLENKGDGGVRAVGGGLGPVRPHQSPHLPRRRRAEAGTGRPARS